RLELGLGHGPLLDARENLVEARQPGRGPGVVGMGFPAGLANDVADLLPNRRLGDEVDVRVGIVLPALTLQNAAGLAATGVVAGARNRIAEGNAFAVLAVFRERTMGEPLLVAQLHACQVQHAVLHGGGNPLSPLGHGALVARGDDPERQMQPGTAVVDLGAGYQWTVIVE